MTFDPKWPQAPFQGRIRVKYSGEFQIIFQENSKSRDILEILDFFGKQFEMSQRINVIFSHVMGFWMNGTYISFGSSLLDLIQSNPISA